MGYLTLFQPLPKEQRLTSSEDPISNVNDFLLEPGDEVNILIGRRGYPLATCSYSESAYMYYFSFSGKGAKRSFPHGPWLDFLRRSDRTLQRPAQAFQQFREDKHFVGLASNNIMKAAYMVEGTATSCWKITSAKRISYSE